MEKVVLSLGGSVIIPDKFDISFVRRLGELIKKHKGKEFIVICGGGKLARNLMANARKINGITPKELDWIGIYATRINALTLKKILGIKGNIITNPTKKIEEKERILVAAGWKPGFSTDTDAVLLAKNIKAGTVINMTNVDYVYDKDPKISGAKPIEKISWKALRQLVGSKWKPGLNMPFDPIAAREAEKLGLKVVIVGKDLKNLEKVISGKKFKGTVIE
ncbi:MAG TPA: UMP kinase [Candidatus Nanoarchaeia archaeon]|nr:UMP kinase [Candidatus Nanoarchaeia archaeon]